MLFDKNKTLEYINGYDNDAGYKNEMLEYTIG